MKSATALPSSWFPTARRNFRRLNGFLQLDAHSRGNKVTNLSQFQRMKNRDGRTEAIFLPSLGRDKGFEDGFWEVFNKRGAGFAWGGASKADYPSQAGAINGWIEEHDRLRVGQPDQA